MKTKTYVMIFGIANIVAGGPIYDCNKIRYLKERGWIVNVLPTDSGKVYIQPLEEYASVSFPFIQIQPYLFTKRELKRKLDLLESYITISDEIIIETGTDYTALWGELLAKRLQAKHIIMFLDEKNSHVNQFTAPFYKFKYERNELASISKKSLEHIFGRYFELKEEPKHVLTAVCSNAVADIKSDLKDKIPDGDYVIGSIGRLDKPFVPKIIDAICEFANRNPEKVVSVCLLGGADNLSINKIKEKLNVQKNIRYFISGYIWPIPKDVFEKIDVFVSAAGSSKVSANQNVPTIRIDVITYRPEGIIKDWVNNKSFVLEKEDASICDYLIDILENQKKYLIEGIIGLQDEWRVVCRNFDKHMEFCNNASSKKEYFKVDKMWNGSMKELMKKALFSIVTVDKYYLIKDRIRRERN